MARMRSLRPDYFLREDMADVSLEAHFLLAGLQVLADRDGRLLDRPRTIKAQVFPFRDVDVEAAMSELVRVRAVARYEVEGRRIIALLTWEDDQTPHPKETSANLQPPPVPPTRTITPPSQPSRKDGDGSGRDPLGLGVGIGSRDGCGSRSSAGAVAPPEAGEEGQPASPQPSPAKKPRKEASGPHAELWRALEAEYEKRMGAKYVSGNGGADASTISWLLANTTPPEAVRRWGNLLAWSRGGFPAVTGFASLRQHWNAPQVFGNAQVRGSNGWAAPAMSSLDAFDRDIPGGRSE